MMSRPDVFIIEKANAQKKGKLVQNLLLILSLCLLFATPASSGSPIVGHPRVIDGDSLNFGKTRVRLQGIDSPERKQLCTDKYAKLYWCGIEATKAIEALIGNGLVRCEGAERDRYKRILSTCYNEAGENLNKWMVRNGWALAYRKYSKRYIREESMAQEEKLGIWAGEFIKPWEWRRVR